PIVLPERHERSENSFELSKTSSGGSIEVDPPQLTITSNFPPPVSKPKRYSSLSTLARFWKGTLSGSATLKTIPTRFEAPGTVEQVGIFQVVEEASCITIST